MKCSRCTRDATGTFWIAYHDFSTIISLERTCEACGQEWVRDWNEPARPRGYYPGIVTDKDDVIRKYLEVSNEKK